MEFDPQIDQLYKCEKCGCAFDWHPDRRLPDSMASDGTRRCPSCKTEFVRKYRQSDWEAQKGTVMKCDVCGESTN
jgi:DNA-directed RNA polymerase subunit RPC12/RpoP